MLRRAFEADQPDHPERKTYVAALQWPDGQIKQAHFTMDQGKYDAMQTEQGENCPSWEHVILQMYSRLIEKILSERRDEVSKLIIIPK
jgi:hypothetical protein